MGGESEGGSECSRILNHAQNRVRGKRVASKGNNGGRVKERLTRWMWVKTTVAGQHSHIELTPWISINGHLMARSPARARKRACVYSGNAVKKKKSHSLAYLLWCAGGVVGFNPTDRNLLTRQNPRVPAFFFFLFQSYRVLNDLIMRQQM